MYVDKEPKEFLESLRYYERAALIDPASGNAQNQVSRRKSDVDKSLLCCRLF